MLGFASLDTFERNARRRSSATMCPVKVIWLYLVIVLLFAVAR